MVNTLKLIFRGKGWPGQAPVGSSHLSPLVSRRRSRDTFPKHGAREKFMFERDGSSLHLEGQLEKPFFFLPASRHCAVIVSGICGHAPSACAVGFPGVVG